MIEKLESANHLVAFRISGSLTAEDVVAANKTVEDAIEAEGRISLFVEIDAAMKFTLQGVLKDISEGIKNWKYLDKIYRTAVVTDHKWMAAIARIEGLVFSGIDLKVFPSTERAKAMVWASEVPPPVEKPEEPTPSIHFLQTTSDNVFAYEVNGRVRERDIKNAVEQMKPFFAKQDKINVLARVKGLSGFDILAFIDDDLIRLKFRAPAKIEKYAVVGAKPWMRNLVELFNPIISTEIRTFEADEEDAAWEWVGASQALLPE
ncbi:MAG: STAS/SEC14 domain-containing protein [Pyrinomonadaceae bacterium]|nr:STAS/SEC14 domain-containing protein [Pyrinomonadaceae bacterium]